ncbi:MFS transporter [Streptomyces sp. NRRL F-5193]|uniref:MFS transporter n=1 Tax=Streptomyces sp. NRRL F-5193 TaxID=1463860 RepID=UPI0005B7D82F|nr:MFS transporter [Streptomyces sp. NRRL F-5193]
MLAAFTFNTAENLPVGLLERVSESLDVPLPTVGLLVTGYGLTVAVASVPLAHLVRKVPRRHVLSGVLAALVVSSAGAALAASYGQLLAARLLTALAQALFWAVMGPVAVGLFAPGVRGRVVAALSLAGSLALVLGVPAGSLLGRTTTWQVPVAALALLGLVSLVTVAALLPTSRPEEEAAAYGTNPDRRAFRTVLAAGFLSSAGAFAGFTYLVTYLGDVSGFSPGATDTLLVLLGVACLAGVGVTGALLDRFPRQALTTAVTVQATGMLGLYATGPHQGAAVAFLILMGAALGPVFMATQNAMLHWAPGRTDLALAANSGAYNAGIAAGAALGSATVTLADLRTTFLTGGLLTTTSCTLLLLTSRVRLRPTNPRAIA